MEENSSSSRWSVNPAPARCLHRMYCHTCPVSCAAERTADCQPLCRWGTATQPALTPHRGDVQPFPLVTFPSSDQNCSYTTLHKFFPFPKAHCIGQHPLEDNTAQKSQVFLKKGITEPNQLQAGSIHAVATPYSSGTMSTGIEIPCWFHKQSAAFLVCHI